jgi:hypothetical protein
VLRGPKANPKDEQVLSVFADSLQPRGSLFGMLGALSGNRKRDGMGAFIEKNAQALRGPAVEDVELGRVRELSWSGGFRSGVAIDELAEERTDTVATVEELVGRLAEAPVATALRDVTLFPTGVPWSEAVKSLELGFGHGSDEEADRHLLALLPRLSGLRHLALREFELTERFCERLFELPMLKQLRSVDLFNCWVDAESTARVLGDERTSFRHLERLASPYVLATSDDLDGAPDADEERERIPVLEAPPNLVRSAWPASRTR